MGLPLENIRRQGYDGCKSMSSEAVGVQAEIRRSLPLAVCTHCSAHALNLNFPRGGGGGHVPDPLAERAFGRQRPLPRTPPPLHQNVDPPLYVHVGYVCMPVLYVYVHVCMYVCMYVRTYVYRGVCI